jgi:hypothetical protein
MAQDFSLLARPRCCHIDFAVIESLLRTITVSLFAGTALGIRLALVCTSSEGSGK